MCIKKCSGDPIGKAKYNFPPDVRTPTNSLKAFRVPCVSRGSPYLPKPICSAKYKHEIKIALGICLQHIIYTLKTL